MSVRVARQGGKVPAVWVVPSATRGLRLRGVGRVMDRRLCLSRCHRPPLSGSWRVHAGGAFFNPRRATRILRPTEGGRHVSRAEKRFWSVNGVTAHNYSQYAAIVSLLLILESAKFV